MLFNLRLCVYTYQGKTIYVFSDILKKLAYCYILKKLNHIKSYNFMNLTKTLKFLINEISLTLSEREK